jgi:hypothetical protein
MQLLPGDAAAGENGTASEASNELHHLNSPITLV